MNDENIEKLRENFQTKVNEKWLIGQKLGSGSFGDIFLATNSQTGEVVAVKMEDGTVKHA